MARKKGVKNVVAFDKRTSISTTASAEIKHLAQAEEQCPLAEFHGLLGHQQAYLFWIDGRHQELMAAKKKLSKNNKGPKDSTYRKYRWYAEQQTLFETINAFEVFYKRTFINLGKALRSYIPADRIKGSVEARVLWAMRGRVSIPSLVVEHQLFHDLDKVDEMSSALISARRYNAGGANAAMKNRIKTLKAIFQIRHTLAHNQGLVTLSDKAKFEFQGYSAVFGEIIDPTKDHLGESVRRFLKTETEDYTQWLIAAIVTYLTAAAAEGRELRASTLTRLQNSLGTSPALEALQWA